MRTTLLTLWPGRLLPPDLWDRPSSCVACLRYKSDRLCLRRLVDRFPVLLVPEFDLALTIRLHREIDHRLGFRAGLDIEVWFLASAHAGQEILDVRRHHVLGVVYRDLNRVNAEFSGIIRPADRFDPCRRISTIESTHDLGFDCDVRRSSFELAVLHHNDGAFMPADQTGNVMLVRHRRTKH